MSLPYGATPLKSSTIERSVRHLPAKWWAAAAICLLLAVAHTWPLATAPGTLSRNDNGDAQLNEWIMAWVAHQLPRAPARLFDANIFYPARDALAFSEPLIVPALLGAPLRWLGGSPVLVFNIVLILGFALTALAMYALVFHWTRDPAAGLLAGSMFAFNSHTLTRLAHIQAIHVWGLPLALLAADRLIVTARLKDALWLAFWMATLAYTSGYLIVFATVMVAVAMTVRISDWWRHAGKMLPKLVLATLATGIAVLPVYLPYRRVAIEQQMVRSLENVSDYSAKAQGYLASAGRIHFETWSGRFFKEPIDPFFPGFLVILLAVAATWHAFRARSLPPSREALRRDLAEARRAQAGARGDPCDPRSALRQAQGVPSLSRNARVAHSPRSFAGQHYNAGLQSGVTRPRVLMLIAIAGTGVVLSLGTHTPVYGWLFTVFPPIQGLRAAARFGNLFLLGITALAGLGFATLRGQSRAFDEAQARALDDARARTRAGLVAALVIAVANIESLRAPFQYSPFEGIPHIYSLVASHSGRVVLVEVPFYPPRAAFENATYVLNSTAHWRPLMNGYSGYTPASYRQYAEQFWHFPEEHAIQAMRRAGATHVMVHARRFHHLPEEVEKVMAKVAASPYLERVALGQNGLTLYRLR
jgi:hypothetical protein